MQVKFRFLKSGSTRPATEAGSANAETGDDIDFLMTVRSTLISRLNPPFQKQGVQGTRRSSSLNR
jgi:hypothetical protein